MLPAPPSPAPPGSEAGPAADRPMPPRPTATASRWRLVGLGAAGLAGCAYLALYDPNSSSSLYPGCPFRAMTGWDCPGCGITRALHSVVTGDLVGAADHNLLLVAVLPLIAWWLVRSVRTSLGRPPRPLSFPWRPWMSVAVGVVIAAWWVLRNLPIEPFAWLGSGVG